eukprot:90126_1
MAHTLCYLLSLLFIIYINGESIQITNPGFEEDDPNLVLNSNSNPNQMIGWTVYDPNDVNRYDSPGVSKPGACSNCNSNQGVSFNDPIYGDRVPEGNACLYLWADVRSGPNPGSFGVEQELSSTFEPTTSYLLSAKVGNNGYNCWSEWNGGNVNWCDSCDGWSGYVIQLVAKNTIVAQDDNSIYIPDQHWATITLNYTTSSSEFAIGSALKIRLLEKNDASATSHCLMYDDVVLTASTASPTALPTDAPSSTQETPLPTSVPSLFPSSTIHPLPSPSTWFPTNTMNPTIAPSITTTNAFSTSDLPTRTTSTYVTQETNSHIVNIDIEFEYECSLDCDTIPFKTLHSICHDISHDLLQNITRRIEDSCVDTTEYIISINPHT